jgi:hypothetical protein
VFLAVIVAGAVGLIQRNVVAVAGRGCPVRRATCAYRWRPVLRDEGTSLFTERSLPGRCHSERCDPNTYVPLRSDALNGYTREGRVDRRIGGCPAPQDAKTVVCGAYLLVACVAVSQRGGLS